MTRTTHERILWRNMLCSAMTTAVHLLRSNSESVGNSFVSICVAQVCVYVYGLGNQSGFER